MTESRRRSIDRLESALPALARLAARHQDVPDDEIAGALGGGDDEPSTFDAARRLTAALSALRRGVEATRQVAVEALVMSGLPESAVLEAVEAVAGSSAPDQVQPLSCTVERLDLGTLALDQPASTTFELTGGPGRLVIDSDQFTVEPLQFGPGVTRIQIAAPPIATGGVLLSALRAVTPSEVLDIPVFARWAAAPAVRAATKGAPEAPAAATAPAATTPAPTTPPVLIKTLLVVSRVTGFPRALALQRAVQKIPGVADAKAIGYEHAVLNLQVMHEARVNLAERVTQLPGFPLRLVESSLGRLQLAAEGR